ncbi:cytochrome P450 [Streptomyces sp. NPDC087908]|uniref:cytochrome P450 n=1 Tax=Streptomyces sp. NPDC087908 TaxID=3365820 RepID=UPI00382DC2B8
MFNETETSELLSELSSEQGRRNPYPIYERLQNLPISYDPQHKAYMVTRYSDCKMALTGKEFSRPASEFFDRRIPRWREHPAIVCGSHMMQFGDDESHPRRRGAVSSFFTPRRVKELIDKEEADVDRLLNEFSDVLAKEGEADLQSHVSMRLPSLTIASMFGIPEEDATRFRPLVMAIVAGLEPGLSSEQITACDDAYEKLREYFQRVIDDRRLNPKDDLSTYIVSGQGGRTRPALLNNELIPAFLSLFAAGTMNTGSFIGNGVVALLQNPEQASLARSDSSLSEQVVTEILRYDAPMQITRRMTVNDVQLGGVLLPKGTHLAIALGAANRDPEAYSDPHSFRVERSGPSPLSLGGGRFYCIGAALGKQEGSLVFRKLLQRFPTIRLAGSPTPNLRAVLRGYTHLPVSLGSDSAGGTP